MSTPPSATIVPPTRMVSSCFKSSMSVFVASWVSMSLACSGERLGLPFGHAGRDQTLYKGTPSKPAPTFSSPPNAQTTSPLADMSHLDRSLLSITLRRLLLPISQGSILAA